MTSRAEILRDVEVAGRRVDVRLARDRNGTSVVAEIGSALPGPTLLHGRGGALLPGLVDHHIHLHALAATDRSVDAATADPQVLARRLAEARGDAHGWVRATGHPGPDPPDAVALDQLHDARPVRLAHHSGAVWTLNTRGCAAVGLEHAYEPGIERDGAGRATGRLWRADAWLRTRLPPSPPPDLVSTARTLLELGVTAVTDATPELDDHASGQLAALPLRVQALGVPLHAPRRDGVATGPYKIVLADHDLPDLDTLTARIVEVHRHRRAVALHCVTREALVLLLTALEAAGRVDGDRIEHAALVPAELIADMRGLRVVTQPAFLTRRGDDYRRDVASDEHDDLYRVARLRAANIGVALSSDGPHGPHDPWSIIEAATRRRTPSGALLGPSERVSARTALSMLLAEPADPGGPARRLRPGRPADLVLLAAPLADVLKAPHRDWVRATLLDGRIVATGAG